MERDKHTARSPSRNRDIPRPARRRTAIETLAFVRALGLATPAESVAMIRADRASLGRRLRA
jgi:hypothetical protein